MGPQCQTSLRLKDLVCVIIDTKTRFESKMARLESPKTLLGREKNYGSEKNFRSEKI